MGDLVILSISKKGQKRWFLGGEIRKKSVEELNKFMAIPIREIIVATPEVNPVRVKEFSSKIATAAVASTIPGGRHSFTPKTISKKLPNPRVDAIRKDQFSVRSESPIIVRKPIENHGESGSLLRRHALKASVSMQSTNVSWSKSDERIAAFCAKYAHLQVQYCPEVGPSSSVRPKNRSKTSQLMNWISSIWKTGGN